MNKILLYLFLLLPFVACNNENSDAFPSEQSFHVNGDFVRLSDDGTSIAGELCIWTNEPEITVRWNVNPCCNLDTTNSVFKVRDGKVELPIQWYKILENGKYGPIGIAYKAGVQIKAGDHVQYVPLVWAERIDSTQIVESAIQTRAGYEMPRMTQVTMLPTTVYMPEQTTGSAAMRIGLEGVSFAVVDISDFLREYRIDQSKIPPYLTESTILTFKWLDNIPSSFNFATQIRVRADGIVQTGYVTYSYASKTNIITSDSN